MDQALSFGARLKHLRRAAQLTQAELAEQAGYSTSYISQLERGEKLPIAATVELLAHALGLDAAAQQQLSAALRPATMPDVPSLPPRATLTLPQPVKPLIGRQQTVQMLTERLTSHATNGVLALWGLPGVGKTTLALAVAHHPQITAHFVDGVLWAGLGPNGQPLGILQSWGRALGVDVGALAQAPPLASLGEMVRQAIGNRRLLLVLDDAWRLEDALALRIGGPNCAHLLTTRFPPLAARFAHEAAMPVPELSASESRRLLWHLAPTAFAEGEASAASDQVVQTAGGLPLALTLIGHYLHSQAISGQPRRVQAALRHVLQAGHRLALAEPYPAAERPTHLAPSAERSLAAVIALSIGGLPNEAQAMLHCLALFPPKPNTFTEEAACALSTTDRPTALALLDQLLDAGVLESAAPGRYQLHQTIVDYLRLSAPDPAAQARFIAYFTDFARQHAHFAGALDREATNIAMALELAFDAPSPAPLLHLTESLADYWRNQGALPQFVRHLRRMSALPAMRDQPSLHAKVQWHLARAMLDRNDLAQATAYAHEATTLALVAHDPDLVSNGYLLLGIITARQGDAAQSGWAFAAVRALANGPQAPDGMLAVLAHLAPATDHLMQTENYYLDGLMRAYQTNMPFEIIDALRQLAQIAGQRGHYGQALRLGTEALGLAHALDAARQIADLLYHLGTMLFAQGQLTKAHTHLQESLAQAGAIEHHEGIVRACAALAELMMALGETEIAYTYIHEGLMLARQIGQPEPLRQLLLSAGRVALQERDLPQAEQSLSEALLLARQKSDPYALAESLIAWGQLALQRDQLASAQSAFSEALTLATTDGLQAPMGCAWCGLALIWECQSESTNARHAADLGETLLAAIGARWPRPPAPSPAKLERRRPSGEGSG